MASLPYFYPDPGGVETYVYNISKTLIHDLDNEVVVICSNWEKEGYKEEIIDGIKVYRLPWLFKASHAPINSFFYWNRKIKEILKKEKPDIVNGHNSPMSDIVARAAKRKKIPFVLNYHNDPRGFNFSTRILARIYWETLQSGTLRISEKILIFSKAYMRRSRYLNKFHDKLVKVPVCIDTNLFREMPSGIKDEYGLNGEKVVLFVARLEANNQWKGLLYLLKAIKLLKKQDVNIKLLVAGGGDFLGYYEKNAVSLGIDEDVIFTGNIKYDQLPEFYNSSDVFVLPSTAHEENFGIVLLEAQACGLPVIGTTCGGIPDALIDGVTGMLVKPKDPALLANGITKILEDGNANKMGEEGLSFVKNNFTNYKAAKSVLDIYNEVIN